MTLPAILSFEEVLANGIEFEDDVCFSGPYGQEVYDKPMEEGGQPITGILYELYENGNPIYYSYYKDGISEGEYVTFYENGQIESYQVMHQGCVHGTSTSWFENGEIKSIAEAKYGFKLTYKEWDMYGNLLSEKLGPDDFEKTMIEKYDSWAAESRKQK